MINIKIDDIALGRIMMNDSGVKIIVKCDIPEYKIKYLIKELEDLGVSEDTLKTLRVLDKIDKCSNLVRVFRLNI